MITSASDNELINHRQCRLHFRLGSKTFEYHFQIIKNLKQDIILGLNFHRMFKISQNITDDNDLYLHIRNKIITFSAQATNVKNYISIYKSMQIKPRSCNQFAVKASKGLKDREIYEIDYNTKGIPKDICPVLDTFIAKTN